jgi:hypothetical protein
LADGAFQGVGILKGAQVHDLSDDAVGVMKRGGGGLSPNVARGHLSQ